MCEGPREKTEGGQWWRRGSAVQPAQCLDSSGGCFRGDLWVEEGLSCAATRRLAMGHCSAP